MAFFVVNVFRDRASWVVSRKPGYIAFTDLAIDMIRVLCHVCTPFLTLSLLVPTEDNKAFVVSDGECI